MILQINPSALLEMAGACGPLTYFLTAVSIVIAGVTVYVWREWRIESKRKDEQIAELGERILIIKEDDANRALLNLEVFNKLTDALDRILVDDRENAEAIKVLIKDIRLPIVANKEVFMLRLKNIEDSIKDGKS